MKMLGVVDDDDLEDELRSADVALVSQNHHGAEFNIPSKIMNFMMYGLPVLAAVNPDSEVVSIVEKSGGGWVVDSGAPDTFPAKLVDLAATSPRPGTTSRTAADWPSGTPPYTSARRASPRSSTSSSGRWWPLGDEFSPVPERMREERMG